MKTTKDKNLPEKFRRESLRAISELPVYASDALLARTFTISLCRRASEKEPLNIPEAALGFMSPHAKVIYCAAQAFNQAVKKWQPNTHPRRVLFHETGHFIDLFVMGAGKPRESVWAIDDGYASSREDFKTSFAHDVTGLRDTNFAALYAQGEAYRERYNKDPEGFLRGWQAELEQIYFGDAAEIYAELWAELHGACNHRSIKLAPLFPRCTEILRGHIATMAVRFAAKNPAL